MNSVGYGIETGSYYPCVLVDKGNRYGVALNGKVKYFSNSALQREEAAIAAHIAKSGNAAALAAHLTNWESYN